MKGDDLARLVERGPYRHRAGTNLVVDDHRQGRVPGGRMNNRPVAMIDDEHCRLPIVAGVAAAIVPAPAIPPEEGESAGRDARSGSVFGPT
jgi:hypothetical protein